MAFRGDWLALKRIKQEPPIQMDAYRVQAIENGIDVLQCDGPQKPDFERQLRERVATHLAPDPRQPANNKL